MDLLDLSDSKPAFVRIPAADAIEGVRLVVAGLPVYIAGSAVAAAFYDQIDESNYDDVDVFCSTSNALVAATERLTIAGYVRGDRMERVWSRWMRFGFKTWHTNSLKLMHPTLGVEYNIVYKLTEGHAATSLGEVLESFDFGLLAVGWDIEHDVFRDMRSFLFPDEMKARSLALPLMPNKRTNWRNGFISQYNGLREAGRYAKYHGYGYDLSLVKDDLLTGYWSASSYLSTCFDADKQLLGKIYETIALHIEADNIEQLSEANAQLDYKDELDVIMEALE